MGRILMLSVGFWLISAGLSTAQTGPAWVTDQLQLGLHRNSDTSGSAFKVLVSGTELTVLERNRFYARVRTTDGEEGWVKAGYLLSNKPAAARVMEVEKSNSELSDSLQKTQTDLDEANAALSKIQAAADDLTVQVSENSSVMSTLQTENQDFRNRLKAYKGSLPLSWVALSLGLMLAVGFIGGLKWEDHQSRKRHGGIRVR
ncbi:MAG: TIGR04211 family SH3 domain-containing protein [Pseudomonadota bacterium]